MKLMDRQAALRSARASKSLSRDRPRRELAMLMRSIGLCAVLLCAAPHLSAQGRRHVTATTPAESAIKNIFWQPNDLRQGSVTFVTVELTKPAARVTGTFAGKRISFFKETPTLWHALAGDDVQTKPGSYTLGVVVTLTSGRTVREQKPVDIADGTFKTGDIQLPENYVNPTADDKRQIAKDQLLKTRAYARSATQPLWSGNFEKPVPAPPTDSFGESRILNEERESLHRGTDYPVKSGTPVIAANSGRVVLAAELFYEGNCVLVDHGEGLFTIYMHLSKTVVKAGETVTKGQRLGLSGETGRVTGPHMHFGVRLNGAYLDPVQLLALTLPKTTAAQDERTAPRRR